MKRYSITDVKLAIKHCEEVIKGVTCATSKCKKDHIKLKFMLEDLLEKLKEK